MGLTSALQVGRSALQTSQAAIELAGNNLSNVATRGYSRQEMVITPAGVSNIGGGNFIGRGVQLEQIIRRTDEALNSRLRGSIADQSGALMKQEIIGQIEALQNELTGIDLSTNLNDFFNAFGDLSNRPLESSLRSLVLQRGETLAGFVRDLRGGLSDLREQLDTRIRNSATAANDLLTQIEALNEQISFTEGGAGSGAHGLRDQRDQILGELSKYIDISVIEQASGVVDVFVGSTPIVLNGKSRGLEVRVETTNGAVQHDVVVADDGTRLRAGSGEIGALIDLRENSIDAAVGALDDFAGELIRQVNLIHASGQGSTGFASVTGATQVLDATVALSDPDSGLGFTPNHGSFQVHVTQKSTGQRITTTINVDLDGINAATDTTLNSLTADIDAITNVTASVTLTGKLQMSVDSSDFEVSFSDDTSGALAALGVNTFFTGTDSFDIGVNQVLQDNVSLVAAGQGHVAGDNRNAIALEGLRQLKIPSLGGLSLTDMWGRHVEDIAIQLDQANRQVEADSVVRDSLEAQRQNVSGVNADEEAINLLTFQRMFQASAKFLSIVDEMMQTLMQVI
jgi:flagellar hook-associated protein 1 FlgK